MSQGKISRKAIADSALDLLGSPYVMHGRGEKVDCIGVLVIPAKANGVELSDVKDYSAQPTGQLIPHLRAQLDEIPTSEAGPGDILAMCWGSRQPSHVAMIVGRSEDGSAMILHATNDRLLRSTSTGTVRLDALTGVMLARVYAAFRFRGTVE